jgi:hypothetical protein
MLGAGAEQHARAYLSARRKAHSRGIDGVPEVTAGLGFQICFANSLSPYNNWPRSFIPPIPSHELTPRASTRGISGMSALY